MSLDRFRMSRTQRSGRRASLAQQWSTLAPGMTRSGRPALRAMLLHVHAFGSLGTMLVV